jgi:hypothetical protein
MRFSTHGIARVAFVGSVLSGSLVAACGSDAGPVGPVMSSQELLCASKGIHVEDCVGIINPGPPRKPVTPLLCLDNPHCPAHAVLTPLASFDSAAIVDAIPGSACVTEWTDDDLPGQLATAGCSAPYVYGTSSTWAFAFCPTIVTVADPNALNVGTMPCDTCTGAAPSGSYIVVFQVSADRGDDSTCACADAAGKFCHPNGGCDEVSCLQNGLSDYTPVTASTVTLPGGG